MADESDAPKGASRPARTPTVDELVGYFHGGDKPRSAFRVGVEQEKIAVRADGMPVPYEGPDGIAALLAALEARGFSAQREGRHTIALARGGDRITVEPGGQVELSGAALPTAAECAAILRAHVVEVREAGASLDMRFLGIGARPFGTIDDVPWLPKRRYAVMRAYFPEQGKQSRLAHYMMKQTATVQANFDYLDEAEAVAKMRTAFGVTSIVTALFAASPVSEGRPNGYKSVRAAIWLETDEERAGLLPFVFAPGFCFGDYAAWALDVPMFFVLRGGVYRPTRGLTFRRFLGEGFEGETATMADWELHLSTLFPEVRLKRYIELRGADAGPLDVAMGLAALWRGLLDDATACAAAWGLVTGASMSEREALRRAVPREGLAARLGRHVARDLAVELVAVARAGLARLPGGGEDARLLAPLEAYASAGRCPADELLDDFARAGGDPARLVAKWELVP
ncbi:MAG TPA: glutamate-cysteine ligase family protein [Polyangia bacterium]|nr:glutamate-cysteine ligase family protein [Polyangia bacterium]